MSLVLWAWTMVSGRGPGGWEQCPITPSAVPLYRPVDRLIKRYLISKTSPLTCCLTMGCRHSFFLPSAVVGRKAGTVVKHYPQKIGTPRS